MNVVIEGKEGFIWGENSKVTDEFEGSGIFQSDETLIIGGF